MRTEAASTSSAAPLRAHGLPFGYQLAPIDPTIDLT
jgi:hypothetical protein